MEMRGHRVSVALPKEIFFAMKTIAKDLGIDQEDALLIYEAIRDDPKSAILMIGCADRSQANREALARLCQAVESGVSMQVETNIHDRTITGQKIGMSDKALDKLLSRNALDIGVASVID